jgi:hypothetical protein
MILQGVQKWGICFQCECECVFNSTTWSTTVDTVGVAIVFRVLAPFGT